MIRLRGYEAKYQHDNDELNVTSGGVMWITDDLLHFVRPEVNDTADLLNSPFDFNELMLASPFSINDKLLFEEDLVEYITSGTVGTIKQDEHQGWIILTEKGHKFSLVDSLEDIILIGNTLETNDKFIPGNHSLYQQKLLAVDKKNWERLEQLEEFENPSFDYDEFDNEEMSTFFYANRRN